MMSKFSLDRGIFTYATNKGKVFDKLDDLESDNFLSCFVGTDQQNIRLIKKLISTNGNYMQNQVRNFMKLADDYRNGRSAELISSLKDSPNCLLAERNKQWMFKIKSILDNYEKPFFVVGVGHLIDEKDSLIELLKNDGYSVELIQFQ